MIKNFLRSVILPALVVGIAVFGCFVGIGGFQFMDAPDAAIRAIYWGGVLFGGIAAMVSAPFFYRGWVRKGRSPMTFMDIFGPEM